MTRVALLSILLIFVGITAAGSQTLVNVETDSWVYPVLDRFVAKGYVYVDTEARPLTRGEIAGALRRAALEQQETRMSPVDRYLLSRLMSEFSGELADSGKEAPSDPLGFQDQPFLELRKDGGYMALDAALLEHASMGRTRLKDSLCDIDTLLWHSRTSVELDSRGQFGQGPAFAQNLLFTRIEGDEEPSSGAYGAGLRAWKSGTAEVERAYLKHPLGPVELEFGRDRFWWGPGRWGTLILSDGGAPLDIIGIGARYHGVAFRGFTAVLSPYDGIYLSAHRLSIQLPLGTLLGFTEAVVYQRDSYPELQYVNPLIPYYLAEHNLKQDDNTLWNFSLVTCPGAGIRFYGEFLIDDFRYVRSEDAPDKLAGLVGFQVADPLGLPDSDIRCEYTRINKWVYTHRDSINTYANYGTALGDTLGPDSDRLLFSICHRPATFMDVLLGYRYLRHGEGTLGLSWEEEGGEPRPQFPSGIVETFNSLFARANLRPVWWGQLDGGVMYTRSRNSTAFGVCPQKPIDRWDFDLALRLDI